MHNRHLKLCFAGNSNVGKTTLHNLLFNKSIKGVAPNDGNVFSTQVINHNGSNTTVDVWDTTGAARIQHSTAYLYTETDILIVVCDITDHESYEFANTLVQQPKESHPEKHIILIVNKADQIDARNVSVDEINQLTKQCDSHIQMSAMQQDASKKIQPIVYAAIDKISKQYLAADWTEFVPDNNVQPKRQAAMKKLAATEEHYAAIINSAPNKIEGIKALFRDYAHPPLFSFHPNRHHKLTATNLVNSLPHDLTDALVHLQQTFNNLRLNPKFSLLGSMSRRLQYAINIIDTIQPAPVNLKRL